MIKHDIKAGDIVYFTEETFNNRFICINERRTFIENNYGKPLKVLRMSFSESEIFIEGYNDFFFPYRFIKKSYDLFDGQSGVFEL